MKKGYIKPEMICEEIVLESMIAASVGLDDTNPADPRYPGGGDANIRIADDDLELF